jgi:chorismate dehydratase
VGLCILGCAFRSHRRIADRACANCRRFPALRDAGLAHIDALADEWSTRIALPCAKIQTYFTENIWYLLDDACLAGLELFYRYGVECGALPVVPNLHFL